MYGIAAAIQVGDFGFFPHVLHKFLQEGPRRFSVPLHVIDGNHEDHGWLTKCRSDGTLTSWQAANLHLHARGTVADIGGLQIGFLGGALHADRRQEWAGQWKPAGNDASPHGKRRVPRDPAWANWVTAGDIERTLSAFIATRPDVIISHSCPAGIGVGMVGAMALIEDVDRFITRAGHHSGPFHDCGEGGLTRLWHALPARPRHWLFGHFHQLHQRVVEATTFTCVGSTDYSDGVVGVRPVVLNTATGEVIVDPSIRL